MRYNRDKHNKAAKADPRMSMVESDEGKNATITGRKPNPSEIRFIESAVTNNVMFKKLG
jgi:hypothetical protein